jgi:hypothetical protein
MLTLFDWEALEIEHRSKSMTLLREQLGDFSSIICLKAMITGMEDALGAKATAIALTTAGRTRGRKLATELGLRGCADMSLAAAKLREALGPEGTRLLIIEKIEQQGENILISTSETVCSAGEPDGADRKCTFTLGAVCGAMEVLLDKRFQSKQIESVLRGGKFDVFELTPV